MTLAYTAHVWPDLGFAISAVLIVPGRSRGHVPPRCPGREALGGLVVPE